MRPAIQPNALRRSAFTLVELLVTVVIIAIVTGLVLGGMYAAQQRAMEVNTQSLIAKLDGPIMTRWESYKTRRIQLSPAALERINDIDAIDTIPPALENARERTLYLRELMRLEMPQRWEDIVADPSATYPPSPIDSNMITPMYLPNLPALYRAYYQRYISNGAPPTQEFESAECLYLILTTGALEDESFAEQLRNLDVGDADGDGMLEFHDGWGNPIMFLRWAPGFASQRQIADPVNRHDPFDPLRQFPDAYALYPLIISAGPDGVYDIHPLRSVGQPAPPTGLTQAELTDPYHAVGSNPLPGAADDVDGDGDNSIDNIHNHLLGSR